ncbi:SCP-like extracellular protein (macronuclear) [Tetrahymena thermophila SB210]|uniref:SCP-like extracellular protein n=1 Tax=Tetrahymena thermophila (strain SB210) TaxID=312017 RepID=W7XKD9_TETTS|nr:SCP-like extracellular protein [Tetrahymena thermophila SB210]EWS74819.1 SCP-like extracellular protein [Tetrahymena thermophila SB210]|eukprot:XP_012652650.1 SCP-like extracellular protein [Tetrahymena thermophila SB210]
MKFQTIFYLFLILLGGAQAANTLINSGLTDAQRQILLDTHNIVRNKIAGGEDKSQPQAANMMAMNWSISLEAAAQAWANNLSQVMVHSDDKDYGENLAESGWTTQSDYDPASQVIMWFYEYKDPSWQTSYISAYQYSCSYGHYSQVVWAKSNSLGCGHSYFFDGTYYQHYTVCQYEASGNYLGQPVYVQGTPCSQCGSQQCNTKYTSLCGVTNAVNTSSNPSSTSSTTSTASTASKSQLLSFAQFVSIVLLLTYLMY